MREVVLLTKFAQERRGNYSAHAFMSKKTCLYKILFLTTIETIETTFVTM